MSNYDWEEDFEPTDSEYLKEISRQTYSIDERTEDIENELRDGRRSIEYSIDSRAGELSAKMTERLFSIRITNYISIALSLIVLYKVW